MRRKNKNPGSAPVQRYKWKTVLKSDNFKEANTLQEKLGKEGKRVKVKRSGQGGFSFSVKVGSPVSTADKAS